MKKEKTMVFDILDEIIPKNPDLIKTKTKSSENKTQRKTKNTNYNWEEESTPFKNCNTFIAFYRGKIKSFNDKVQFMDISIDRAYSTQILDILIKNKRKDSKFVTSWIKYFFDIKISGKISISPESISLKSFKDTFVEYNNKYLG